MVEKRQWITCCSSFIKGADVNCTEEMYDVISRRVACERRISSDADIWNVYSKKGPSLMREKIYQIRDRCEFGP